MEISKRTLEDVITVNRLVARKFGALALEMAEKFPETAKDISSLVHELRQATLALSHEMEKQEGGERRGET